MANQYHRLLDAQILPPNWVQPKEDVFDAGAWKEVEAHYLRYLRAVTDGAVAGAPAGLIDLVLKN